MAINFNYFIDVSGAPLDKTVVGLASFNPHHISRISKEFKREFPKISRSKLKGAELGQNELEGIMHFLDANDVRTRAITFSSGDWSSNKRRFGDSAYFKERMMAVLYFKLLKDLTKPGLKYTIVMCKESYMDTEKASETLRRLSRANHMDYDISLSIVKQNSTLRFADFVASAGRKVQSTKLDKLKHYKTIPSDLEEAHLRKVFK